MEAKKYSYAQVIDRYALLRQASQEAAVESLPSVLRNTYGEAVLTKQVSLNSLDPTTFRKLKQWERSDVRRVTWDWDIVQQKYRALPKRFEASIWYRDVELCGACIGKPTFSKGKLRLDYIESAPMKTKLDGLITDIFIEAGINYARLIGASQIRIMHPVNEKVRDYYLNKPGFQYNKDENYCFREL